MGINRIVHEESDEATRTYRAASRSVVKVREDLGLQGKYVHDFPILTEHDLDDKWKNALQLE